jgi:hypothetical protein
MSAFRPFQTTRPNVWFRPKADIPTLAFEGLRARLVEDRFDGLLEELRYAEGQRERGIVLPILYGVHRLSGHGKPFSQLRLTPGAGRSKLLDTIVHGLLGCEGRLDHPA